jgi:hypothetical protein
LEVVTAHCFRRLSLCGAAGVGQTPAAWHHHAMGVMYDYFSAASDESAAATIDMPGGPDGLGWRLPMPAAEIVRPARPARLRDVSASAG